MLMRFDPWREFDRVASQLLGGLRTAQVLPMDAYRRGEHFVIELDVPGVDPDAIELTVEKNVLTVTARRSFDRSDWQDVVVNERPDGVFTRQVFLGEGLDTDHLTAEYRNGVLTIRIPVREEARPRRIPITAAAEQKELETTAS